MSGFKEEEEEEVLVYRYVKTERFYGGKGVVGIYGRKGEIGI